jgi:hypothetical protein
MMNQSMQFDIYRHTYFVMLIFMSVRVHSAESIFAIEFICEFESKFKKALTCESGGPWALFAKKPKLRVENLVRLSL